MIEKTKAQQQFDDLVAYIWTNFKPLGYKKKGNNFRFYDKETGWGKIVNFQKSFYGTKNDIHFTVNIGLYLSDYEFYALDKRSGENFTEPLCPVRNRIGRLADYQYDKWYDINDSVDIEKLRESIGKDFVQFVIPYLDRYKAKEDILLELSLREGVLWMPIAAIKTMFYNGYEKQAFNLMKHYQSHVDIHNEIFLSNLEKMRKELFGN